jgi:addiction module RelE/StbE family toxin
MRKLAWHHSFRRAFRRHTHNNPALQRKILDALRRIAEDPFEPQLKTHKLRGRLEGLWACWVEYDCRIVFTFEPEPDTNEELIVLIDLGRHNEVY